MKKAIITLAITAFITGTVLMICKEQSTKTFIEKDKMTQSKNELYKNLNDSLQQFSKESDAKIDRYEISISENKSRIVNEKIYNKAGYAKKIAEFKN